MGGVELFLDGSIPNYTITDTMYEKVYPLFFNATDSYNYLETNWNLWLCYCTLTFRILHFEALTF